MEVKKVFISYSRADYIDSNNNPIDNSVVALFVDALRANGIDVWIDLNAHYSGQYFAKVLAKKILWADKILFLSSSNSNSSDWVCKEIIFAAEKQKEIVPVRIDNSDYNEGFALLLSGIDFIEYYKNPNQSLEKTIKLLKGNDDIEEVDITNLHPTSNKFFSILKIVSGVLLVLLCIFTLFASIGFTVGYFSNKTDTEELISNAFREHRITALNAHTIKYSGESINFIYDIESEKLKLGNEEVNFFKNITFEKVAMAVSVPLAFKNLFKAAKYSGNSKTKAGVIIAGSIGILCGYSIGEPIGENYALWINEKSLEEILCRESVKNTIKQELKEIYQ